jgi:tRNA pseudouridine38-40 synthase
MRYFVELAYNGKNYFGWQVQPCQVSVQEVLTHAVRTLLKEPVILTGAGRTDSGVHARIFFAHFDTVSTLSQDTQQALVQRLNAFLPADICIYRIFPVVEGVHARFDALSRTYCYYISQHKNPFNGEFTYRCYRFPDAELMNRCCVKLKEYTDFSSFSKRRTQTRTNICHIQHAQWHHQREGELVFEITADRFLRNMVRAIVGTMLEVGYKKLSVDDFCQIIAQKNRSLAGMSVPAHALFLEKITYPAHIYL